MLSLSVAPGGKGDITTRTGLLYRPLRVFLFTCPFLQQQTTPHQPDKNRATHPGQERFVQDMPYVVWIVHHLVGARLGSIGISFANDSKLCIAGIIL
jgi:hypothetical protein